MVHFLSPLFGLETEKGTPPGTSGWTDCCGSDGWPSSILPSRLWTSCRAATGICTVAISGPVAVLVVAVAVPPVVVAEVAGGGAEW